MIQFRCWYCNKYYAVADARRGQQIHCTCSYLLRVPKRSGGNSRVKTFIDWMIEAILYGGGGALLGLGLSLLILSRLWLVRHGWIVVLASTSVGFLAGLLCGERGLLWLGGMIRDRENS